LAERKRKIPPWLWALIGLGGALLVVFALVVGPWLFTRFPHEGITAEQELKAKNDVRTTLVQALAGLAVAGGLVVTYRTYQHNRIEQDRTFQQSRIEQDRTYQLRQAEQVNELYTRAVEQLGHEEAPVRLGALYSLVHLAQANPDRRPTVVDVLCAYLRMPYAPPESAEPADVVAGEAPSGHRDQPGRASKRDPAQELQVRLTAERLLSEHVRRPDGVSGEDAQHLARSPDESYWPNISLDLTGAFLIGLNLSEASVVDASFAMATFSTGGALFDGATFTGNAKFGGATFTGDAKFGAAIFTGDAWFDGAIFTGSAVFTRATFTGYAGFREATFTGDDAKFDWGDLHRLRRVREGDLHRRRVVHGGDLRRLRRVRGGDLQRRRLVQGGDLRRLRRVRGGDLHRRRHIRGGDLAQASPVRRGTSAEPQ
jgi:Pentapeptide repeats (9 copies)